MQYSLGLPEKSEQPSSYGVFFGLRPDEETSRRIDRFAARWMRDRRLTWQRRERLLHHVSLQGVCNHPCPRTKDIYAAKSVGASVALPSFQLTFRAVKSLEGMPAREDERRRYPLVLLAAKDDVAPLYQTLGSAMARQGLRPSPRLTPHLTLAYGPRALPWRDIEPISFVVREFYLIRSAVGLSEHTLVARWPLNG